ncbi:unnamed protein product [Macrosiphum euphorbiae]|uniref:Secreted protein n=1 Tax=Macrosiphum euphorbiae TaxID=13131 RepID=A0AAV0VKQ3_9HEMI|nr:unnamed protein product [Macrosiphum euphorbiae]
MRRKTRGSPPDPALVALLAVAALIAAAVGSSPDGQQAQQTQPQQQQASGKLGRFFTFRNLQHCLARAGPAPRVTATTGFPCVCIYLQLFVPSVPGVGDRQ